MTDPRSGKTRSISLEGTGTPVSSEVSADRFWSKVRVAAPDACWEWTASRFRRGYGQFGVNRRPEGAHRVAWTLSHGPIPEGQHVLHICDNRGCCNPAHLFLGTHADNMRDASAKGRLSTPRPSRRKLTDGQCIELRRLAAEGMTGAALADRFGVSASWVCLFLQGKRRQYDRVPEAVSHV